MEILHLEPEVVCRLRSGICITSCAHAVEELVLNAIDAAATCVAVRLNLQFFKIQVVDNGEGIPVEHMKNIGERYMTSKCHTLEDLKCIKSGGFRGEALSSLKDVSSVLEIVSRHCKSEKTFCKIFKHGHSLSTKLSNEPRPSRGTTVTVLDFLYNMPVRRKCVSEALDLEQCRKCIENIALIHPGVSFSLRNDTTGEVCLQTRKCNLLLSVFTQIFGYEKATSLKEVLKEHGRYHIEGYVSTEGHISKDLQFLYVNKRYVSKTKIHKLINKILTKALFTRQKISLKDTTPNSLADSPSKNQIRYCIFILNILCPFDEYDIVFEPRKTMVEFENWDVVTELVQSVIFDFLVTQKLVSPLSDSDTSSSFNSLISRKADISKECFAKLPENYGKDISIENARNALFSAAARRAAQSEKDEMVVTNDKIENHSVVSSSGSNKDASESVASVTLLADANVSTILPQTLKPGTYSNLSSCDSEFSTSSAAVIPPIMHKHDNFTSFSDMPSSQSPCTESEKGFSSQKNLYLSSCSDNEDEDPLFVRKECSGKMQDSATPNDRKWQNASSLVVRNPIVLGTPADSSISLFKEHIALRKGFSSDELQSPDEIKLPDVSVIPSKNPILLKVRMQNSLSSLEKHAKRTEKFAELKNRYQFSSSSKKVKTLKGVHKTLPVIEEKRHKTHNKNNHIKDFSKVKNGLLKEKSFVEPQQQQCHLKSSDRGNHAENLLCKVKNIAKSPSSSVIAKCILREFDDEQIDINGIQCKRNTSKCEGTNVSVTHLDCSESNVLKNVFEEFDIEQIDINDVVLGRKDLLKSIKSVPSVDLVCSKGTVNKAHENRSSIRTSDIFGGVCSDKTDNYQFNCNLVSFKNKQPSNSVVVVPRAAEKSKKFRELSCRSSLFDTCGRKYDVNQHLNLKFSEQLSIPHVLSNELGVFSGTESASMMKSVAGIVSENQMPKELCSEKVASCFRTLDKEGCIELKNMVYTRSTSKCTTDTRECINSYGNQETRDEILKGKDYSEKAKNDINKFGFQLISFKNRELSPISSGEGIHSVPVINKTLSNYSVFSNTCGETPNNVPNFIYEDSYECDSSLPENLEDFMTRFSKSELSTTNVSTTRAFPETQPFSVTEQKEKSLRFEPENDEISSKPRAEEVGSITGTEICPDLKAADSGNGKMNIMMTGCSDSYDRNYVCDVPLVTGNAYQSEELLTSFPDVTSSPIQKSSLTVESSDDLQTIKILEQKKDEFKNVPGSNDVFRISSCNKNNCSISEILVKDTESQEKEVLSNVNFVSSDLHVAFVSESTEEDLTVLVKKRCERNANSTIQSISKSFDIFDSTTISSENAVKRGKQTCMDEICTPSNMQSISHSDESYSDVLMSNKVINSISILTFESTPQSINDYSYSMPTVGDTPQKANLGSSTDMEIKSLTLGPSQNAPDLTPIKAVCNCSLASCCSCSTKMSKNVKSDILLAENMNTDISATHQEILLNSEKPSETSKILSCGPFQTVHANEIFSKFFLPSADAQMTEYPKQLYVNISEDLFPSKPEVAPPEKTYTGAIPIVSHPFNNGFSHNTESLEKNQGEIEAPSWKLSTSNLESPRSFHNQVSKLCVPEVVISSAEVNSQNMEIQIASCPDSLCIGNLGDDALIRVNPIPDGVVCSKRETTCNRQESDYQTLLKRPDPSFLANTDSCSQQHRKNDFITEISNADNALLHTDSSEEKTNETEGTVMLVTSNELVCAPLSVSATDPEVKVNLDVPNQCLVDVNEIQRTSMTKLSQSVQSDSVAFSNAASDTMPTVPGSRWFSQKDPVTREYIYFDSVTGNSFYVNPGENLASLKESEYTHQRRKTGQKVKSHFFLSHNSTPFLPRPPKLRRKCEGGDSSEGKSDSNVDVTELKDNLVNYLEEMEGDDLAKKWKPDSMSVVDVQVEEIFNNWENPMFLRCSSEVDLPTTSVKHLQQNQAKMYSIINSYRFSKHVFSHLQVIGQVDCKFLACVVQDVNENIKGKKLLVLFDQHAVHERIRLEELVDDIFEVNRQGQKVVKASELSTTLVIHLKQEEIRLLKTYHDKLAAFGLKLSVQEDSQDVEVHTVPSCLIERENSDLKRKRQPITAAVVENVIREWLLSLEQTRSATSVLPRTLIGILNSQACRGAVKFGDPLSLEQCQQLMQSLSTCKLPFQCAHGRPSLAPLLDLQKVTNFHEKKPRPKLSKLMKMKVISYS